MESAIKPADTTDTTDTLDTSDTSDTFILKTLTILSIVTFLRAVGQGQSPIEGVQHRLEVK